MRVLTEEAAPDSKRMIGGQQRATKDGGGMELLVQERGKNSHVKTNKTTAKGLCRRLWVHTRLGHFFFLVVSWISL